MFALIASLALSPAAAAIAPKPADPAPAVSSKRAGHAAEAQLPAGPWWEKVIVTMDAAGTPKSCKYESSTEPAADNCALSSADFSDKGAQASDAQKDQFLTLTFERRFVPGASVPPDAPLQTGDTLLGSEMMALAIDSKGKVTGCKVVASTGDMPPDYSCDDASAEHFADAGKGASRDREGFMSVRIYGHSEHVVMRDRKDVRRA